MSVEPQRADVKGGGGQPVTATRRYDASRRRVGAARRQKAVLVAARTRFLRDGYAGTTIAAIAAEAGVSVDTVYRTFGGKPGLVRAVHACALEGTGALPAETRSDDLRGRLAPPALVRAWGELLAEVMPLVAPVLLLVRDAARSGDPHVVALLAELDAERLRRMTDNAQHLGERLRLRPGTTVGDAAEVLWTWSAPELYELFVLRRGWSPARYGHHAGEVMVAQLLAEPGGAVSRDR